MDQGRGKMMRVRNVARRLDVHRCTVIRMIEAGKLRAVKLGAHWRVEENSVIELIEKGAAK